VQAVAAAASSLQVVLVGEFVAVQLTEQLVVLIRPVQVPPGVTTGTAATVKVVEADPTLPAWSVAATVMVWLPEARPL
jgi:hypothetical protein